jgi:predicted O-methyltransferase YrrM
MGKIVDDPETYFRQWVPSGDPLLRRLEAEAETERIPIVGPLVGELLFVLARAMEAKNILELGAAAGYSAVFLARACALHGGRLTTLEVEPAFAERAHKNLESAGLADRAHVLCGDAFALMRRLEGPFDLIFLDIDKVDYAKVLPECYRLLRSGGLLVADNIAFADAEPFNRAIFADAKWRSVSLFAFLPGHSPERDGLCLALRC